MRVCYILFGCVPSPYPSSSLTVTETRIRWVKKEMNKWGTRAAWWLVGYHQVSAVTVPSYMGTRWNKETGLKMEWDVNVGRFLLLILWFRLLTSLLLLTPDFYFGKSDKRAQDWPLRRGLVRFVLEFRAQFGVRCPNFFLKWIPLLFVGSSRPQCAFHPRLESDQWMLIWQIFWGFRHPFGYWCKSSIWILGPSYSNVAQVQVYDI